MADLRADLLAVLGDVRAAVVDWQAMRTKALEVARSLSDAEAAALLDWMADDHFTFLGYCDVTAAGSGLGVLRGTRASATAPPVGVTVRKSDGRATVHRPVHMEQVCVGPHQFLGLWTSAAYNTSPLEIPLLRRKVSAVLDRAVFPRSSHSGRDLTSILEAYPRDDLFQIDEDELYVTAMGILSLQERKRVRLLVRRDDLGRFFSCLVYLPRDRYTTELARRIEAILIDTLAGTAGESTVRISESVLARLHVIVTLPAGAPSTVPDVSAIEARLAAVARSWTDDLAQELADDHGEEGGIDLLRKYGEAFPAAYREDVDPRTAVGDVARIESLLAGSAATDLLSVVTRPADAPRGFVRMRLFRVGEPMALSDVLPLLEHLGVRVIDERPYEVHPTDSPAVWLYDVGLASPDLAGLDGERRVASSATCSAGCGEARPRATGSTDSCCARDCRAARSQCCVRTRSTSAKSVRRSVRATSRTPSPTTGTSPRSLLDLFEARFDPDRTDDRTEAEELLVTSIVAVLREVASLDEDRILSSFLHLIVATLRTSWYQRDEAGNPKPYMSFKLDPARVPDVPLPRPLFEVWVYSPRAEGVHLRGAHRARRHPVVRPP